MLLSGIQGCPQHSSNSSTLRGVRDAEEGEDVGAGLVTSLEFMELIEEADQELVLRRLEHALRVLYDIIPYKKHISLDRALWANIVEIQMSTL